MTNNTPYTRLPRSSYWQTSVARAATSQATLADLWTPAYEITRDEKILTVGSCFAQHIGRALSAAGFAWHNAEPAPFGLSAALQKEFHFGVFSFRVGNIYTPDVLKSWLTWALDPAAQDREIWAEEGVFYDPLRPQIEPGGFETEQELCDARDATFAAIRNGVKDASVFVFTLGLTECWYNRASGLVYSSCPGTIAGSFASEDHGFRNLGYPDVMELLHDVRTLLRRINPDIRMLLTVSPVPLAATAVPRTHVLTSTVGSKSILRAAAGAFCDLHDDVDYFPSYELVTHPGLSRDMFAPDRRSVRPDAVNYVMQHFFDGLGVGADQTGGTDHTGPSATEQAVAAALAQDDIICEEMELEQFNAGTSACST